MTKQQNRHKKRKKDKNSIHKARKQNHEKQIRFNKKIYMEKQVYLKIKPWQKDKKESIWF